MSEKKTVKGLDNRELKFPETLYIRDIEDRVFQGIVLACIKEIGGIAPVEGGFISSIFSPSPEEGIKGITIEQNLKEKSVGIKVEVNVSYGENIPEKAEEIQSKIAEEITRLTGLHVAFVHVVFKHIISQEDARMIAAGFLNETRTQHKPAPEEEYSEEF